MARDAVKVEPMFPVRDKRSIAEIQDELRARSGGGGGGEEAKRRRVDGGPGSCEREGAPPGGGTA